MSIPLRAEPILAATQRAAHVQLPSQRRLWFPYSQCPDLEGMVVGQVDVFACPRWVIEREDLEEDAFASATQIPVNARILNSTREAAFVEFAGGEQAWLPFERCTDLERIPLATTDSFLCNSYTLHQKELSHYTFSPKQIAHSLRVGSLSLSQAIYTHQIPSKALHFFAYDSAHRILQQTAQLQTDLLLSLWKAMQCKRRWLRDPNESDSLEYERTRIHQMWSTVEKTHLNAVAAVWKATHLDPIYAAQGSAHHIIHGLLSPHIATQSLAQGLSSPEDDELRQERHWQSIVLAEHLEQILRASPRDRQAI